MEMQMILLSMESVSDLLCGSLASLTSFIYSICTMKFIKKYIEIIETTYKK